MNSLWNLLRQTFDLDPDIWLQHWLQHQQHLVTGKKDILADVLRPPGPWRHRLHLAATAAARLKHKMGTQPALILYIFLSQQPFSSQKEHNTHSAHDTIHKGLVRQILKLHIWKRRCDCIWVRRKINLRSNYFPALQGWSLKYGRSLCTKRLQ